MNFLRCLGIREDRVQCFVEIGPKVHGVFESHTESKQSSRQVLLALPSGPSINRRFDATETGATDDES